jgi:PGF-CTERM protein
MKKKIAVGMFLILAIAFALGFETIDRPSVSAVVYSPNETENGNTTWINAEIEDLEKKPELQIAGWIISSGVKEVDLWVYELTPENQQLDGTMIDGWKVNVWEDQKPPEDGKATEEEVAWIRDQIEKWKENPEMQIAGTSIDSSARKTVTLWVYGLTPENQQLHRKMINGWEIIVAQSPIPADKKKSREIAEEYLLNTLTFRFDGIEDSLKLVDTNTLECPYCWEFVFEFQCRHAGYGNRTGQMLAQVITLHTARIIVEQGRVTSAIMDEKWDMLEQKVIDSNNPIISVNSTVFEGERWMSIFSDGTVTCYSDHYYPSHKEIVIKEGHISREEIDVLLGLFSNLSEYSDYTVNVSEQLIRDHMDCIFDPVGGGTKISCILLNKTLRLRVRPPSFSEPETATPTAKEIMERIDKIFREAKIPERRKEINPYGISLTLEPYAPSYQPNQMITFNASLKDGWLGDVTSYEWDFGDGSKDYGETVRHAYATEGNYTVKLTVITSDGAVGVKCKTTNVTRSTLTPALAPEVPGFEAVFTIAGLLAVAYLRRRK